MNDRDETIKRIRTALYRRSGKQWSVTGGRGTAWGWITIESAPKRRTGRHRLKAGALDERPENWELYDSGEPGGSMTEADQLELSTLLALDRPQCHQGVSVPASSAHYREFTERAEGKPVTKVAEAYWD